MSNRQPVQSDYADIDELDPEVGTARRSPADYLWIVLDRIWLVLGVTLVVMLAVYLYGWHFAERYYVARALVEVQPPATRFGSPMSTGIDRESYMRTKLGLIANSRDILKATADELALHTWPEYRGYSDTRILEALADNVSVSPQRDSNLATVEVYARTPDQAEQLADALLRNWLKALQLRHSFQREALTGNIMGQIRQLQDQIASETERLSTTQDELAGMTEPAEQLGVEVQRQQQVLTQLTAIQLQLNAADQEYRIFMDTSPPALEDIASGPANRQAYLASVALDIMAAMQPTWQVALDHLGDQMQTQGFAFPVGHRPLPGGTETEAPATDDDSSMLQKGMAMMSSRNRVQVLESRLLAVREELLYYKSVFPEQRLTTDPAARRTIERLNAQIKSLYQAVADTKRETNKQLYVYLKSQVEKLSAQEAHLAGRLADQMSIVTALRDRMLTFRKTEGRIAVARLNIERLSDTLQALISKRHDLEIEMPNEAGNINLHGKSEALTEPMPDRIRLMVLAVVGGLTLGVMAVVSLTVFDTTVRTPADVETALDTPVLGFVANMEDQAPSFTNRCLVTRQNPRAAPSESFREVRARIIAGQRDEPFKTLLVTSTNPREGKTTVSANLAISLAQAGRRVLLVDATLRHPNLHLVFDLDQSPGFSQLLSGEAKLDDVLHETSVDNLTVVTGGAEPESPAELFATDRAAEVLAALADRFDIVLLDAAPVLGISDTIALSAHVDAALFVVKSAKSKRSVVARARESLAGSGIPLIGSVINDVRYTRGDFYYYTRHY